MDYIQIAQVVVPLLSVGGAWGGAMVALNGTRERVKSLATDLKTHIKDDEQLQRDMIDRAARMETKLDILLEKL